MDVLRSIEQEIDRTIVRSVVTKAIAVAGLASIPLVGPLASSLLTAVLDLFVHWLLKETAIGGARIWVQMNVDWDVKNVDKTTQSLRDVIEHPETYTEAQQLEIEKGFDDAAIDLIHITNARLYV